MTSNDYHATAYTNDLDQTTYTITKHRWTLETPHRRNQQHLFTGTFYQALAEVDRLKAEQRKETDAPF